MDDKTILIWHNRMDEEDIAYRWQPGAKTDTDTVRLGLEALVRHGAYERLRALRGSEPQARETRRRRERATSVRHSAA